jgi:hypothetical protein
MKNKTIYMLLLLGFSSQNLLFSKTEPYKIYGEENDGTVLTDKKLKSSSLSASISALKTKLINNAKDIGLGNYQALTQRGPLFLEKLKILRPTLYTLTRWIPASSVGVAGIIAFSNKLAWLNQEKIRDISAVKKIEISILNKIYPSFINYQEIFQQKFQESKACAKHFIKDVAAPKICAATIAFNRRLPNSTARHCYNYPKRKRLYFSSLNLAHLNEPLEELKIWTPPAPYSHWILQGLLSTAWLAWNGDEKRTKQTLRARELSISLVSKVLNTADSSLEFRKKIICEAVGPETRKLLKDLNELNNYFKQKIINYLNRIFSSNSNPHYNSVLTAYLNSSGREPEDYFENNIKNNDELLSLCKDVTKILDTLIENTPAIKAGQRSLKANTNTKLRTDERLKDLFLKPHHVNSFEKASSATLKPEPTYDYSDHWVEPTF